MNEQMTGENAHKIIIDRRKRVTLTGIQEVISFDDKEVTLETTCGALQLKGEGFKVKRLTLENGEVDMEGHVDQLNYFENQNLGKNAGSFLGKLFR